MLSISLYPVPCEYTFNSLPRIVLSGKNVFICRRVNAFRVYKMTAPKEKLHIFPFFKVNMHCEATVTRLNRPLLYSII